MKRLSMAIAIASLSLAASNAWASAIYNPQAEFSSSNPSGVWSYGVFDTSSSTFTPLSPYMANDGATVVNSWGQFPGVFNNTNATSTTVFTTIVIPGQTLVLHPPNDPTLTDLRFTAPHNMNVSVAATFAAADTNGTSSDAHIYVNGTQVFTSPITGTAGNGAVSYGSGQVFLAAGQTIDFLVGYGSNHTYFNDGTSLVASITTPEPSSIVLLCAGGVSLVVVAGKRIRRRA